MSLEGEIKILQDNMKDLQGQLASAHIRISELIADRDSALEDLKAERVARKLQERQELKEGKQENLEEELISRLESFEIKETKKN